MFELLLNVINQVSVQELAQQALPLCILQVQEYFLLVFWGLSPPLVLLDELIKTIYYLIMRHLQ